MERFHSIFPTRSLKPPVIILSGCTSVGKSAVAQIFCKTIDAEIILADAVQIYKGLQIGSNKPSLEEQKEIPHHMIDILETHEPFSSGIYVELVLPILVDIISRGKTPVIVGGSTMMVQWLVHGVPDAPPSDPEVVKQCQEILSCFEISNSWDSALEFVLSHEGTERASELSKNDWYRLKRVFEISITNKSKTTSNQSLPEKPEESLLQSSFKTFFSSVDLRCFFLSEDRLPLYRTIDSRCEDMVLGGLFQEVYDCVHRGVLTPFTSPSSAIGYRQSLEYLLRGWEVKGCWADDGFDVIQEQKSLTHSTKERNEEPLREETGQGKRRWVSNDLDAFQSFLRVFSTATRNYAKKQLQWYRKDQAFLWMQIKRCDSSSGQDPYAPYKKIAEELGHWVSVPREQYEDQLQSQLMWAGIGNRIRPVRKYSEQMLISRWKKLRDEAEALETQDQMKVDSSNSNNQDSKINHFANNNLAEIDDLIQKEQELLRLLILSGDTDGWPQEKSSSNPSKKKEKKETESQLPLTRSRPWDFLFQQESSLSTPSSSSTSSSTFTPSSSSTHPQSAFEFSAQDPIIRIQEHPSSTSLRTYQSDFPWELEREEELKSMTRSKRKSNQTTTTHSSSSSSSSVDSLKSKKATEETFNSPTEVSDLVPVLASVPSALPPSPPLHYSSLILPSNLRQQQSQQQKLQQEQEEEKLSDVQGQPAASSGRASLSSIRRLVAQTDQLSLSLFQMLQNQVPQVTPTSTPTHTDHLDLATPTSSSSSSISENSSLESTSSPPPPPFTIPSPSVSTDSESSRSQSKTKLNPSDWRRFLNGSLASSSPISHESNIS